MWNLRSAGRQKVSEDDRGQTPVDIMGTKETAKTMADTVLKTSEHVGMGASGQRAQFRVTAAGTLGPYNRVSCK